MKICIFYRIPLFVFFVIPLFLFGAHGASEEDLIVDLPWLNFQPNFKQYSGYLNADNVSFLHYWLVESQNDPARDPLLLWLNGGPGCSSILGLLTENGPLRVSQRTRSVYENRYAWNKVANVLYVESPSVVGFSYNVMNKTNFNDDETALLNYNALKAFYAKFPEYRTSQLFVSGESYAGIYLPTLATYLLKDANIKPNFKGVAIGNGYLNLKYLTNSYLPLVYNHVLLGERKWNKFIEKCCDGNAMDCDYLSISQQSESDLCRQLMNDLDNTVESYGLDPYNLYDTCYVDPKRTNRWRTVYYKVMKNLRKGLMQYKADYRHVTAGNLGGKKDDPDYPDCYYDGDTFYLNRMDVRRAIHIPDHVPKWDECSNTMNYTMQYTDMTPQLHQLWVAKVQVLSYNGDTDTVCNAVGNKQFVDSLDYLRDGGNTSVWTYEDEKVKVAGLQTNYHGVDLISIRGAGHMVPGDKPREALQMIYNFMKNRPYSTPVDFV